MAAKAAPKRKPSVLKRARQAEKRSLRNKSVISSVRTFSKSVLEAIDSKDADKIRKTLKAAVKALSSAASKGIIPKNTASRNISRLAKKAGATLKAGAS